MAQKEIVELPKGWNQSQLKELFDFVIGGDWGKLPEYDDSEFLEVLCIRGSEFRNWSKDKGKTASLRKIKKASLTKRRLKDGDLLIEISGGGPEQPVGRTVLIDNEVLSFNNDLPKVCTNFLRLARPNNKINSKYLNYYLVNFYNSGEISKYQSGSNNLRNLKFKEYETINIPVAPLPEQKRIVEKLDSLLVQVDTIQQRLNNLPDIIKRFRQSVLAAAVSGKLTEQWRGENPVTSMNSYDYFDKKLGDVENKEYYGEPPASWCWVRFGSLVKLINGDRGKNYPNKSEYVKVGVPFINTGHIDPDGSLSISRMNFITKDKFKSLGSGKIQTNDLVYCLRGATMGKTAIVNNFEKGAIASSLVIVRPSDSVNYKFAHYFLISPQAKDLITKFDNGSAQPNLSAKSLAMYPLCLPSLKEQTEIVRLVEQYFALADTLEKNLANAKQRVDNLTQSILAKAFRGELVPQDPNDEPADKLLARIKAARLEAEKLEKAAKKAAKTSKK